MVGQAATLQSPQQRGWCAGNIFRVHYLAVLEAATVFLPEVSVDYPYSGLVELLLGVLGYSYFALVAAFDVAVVEGEIGALVKTSDSPTTPRFLLSLRYPAIISAMRTPVKVVSAGTCSGWPRDGLSSVVLRTNGNNSLYRKEPTYEIGQRYNDASSLFGDGH